MLLVPLSSKILYWTLKLYRYTLQMWEESVLQGSKAYVKYCIKGLLDSTSSMYFNIIGFLCNPMNFILCISKQYSEKGVCSRCWKAPFCISPGPFRGLELASNCCAWDLSFPPAMQRSIAWCPCVAGWKCPGLSTWEQVYNYPSSLPLQVGKCWEVVLHSLSQKSLWD